jgi:hypothetical protein
MKAILTMTVAALMTAGVSPPAAADNPRAEPLQNQAPNVQDPRELLEGGMQMVLQALDLLIRAIPQYAAPEVLENGDIIIRRLPTEPMPKKQPGSPERERQI